MVDEIEKCSEKVFVEMAVDKIMKNSDVSEIQAYEIYNKISGSIEFDSEECNNPLGYYSVRYAIMNRVLRSEY